VKNLNSFRYLSHALEYEIERQIGVLESGGTITQETRLWNVAAGRTEPMRSKEFAHDYRYFPDPDLLPVTVSEAAIRQVREEMPELPAAKLARFLRDYGITSYDAGVLTASHPLADYFGKGGGSRKGGGELDRSGIAPQAERRRAAHHRVPPACRGARGAAEKSGKRGNHRREREKSVRKDV
jgi:hypothetical protein